MNVNLEVQRLKNSRLLRNESEISEFEQAIENILSMNDVNHIEQLCSGFDDATEHDEVMFGLIHAIESYDKIFRMEDSLEKFAVSVPLMYPHAREWAKTFHKRILNHEPSRKIYAKVVSNLDDSIKSTIIGLINEIKKKNPSKFEVSASEFLVDLGR